MFKRIKDDSGASIIFVVIISLVFLLIGASVLTAVSVSSKASHRNRLNKQLYYYSKSAADTINDSINKDYGLGHEIINYIASKMMEEEELPTEMVLDCNISLEKNGVNYDDVTYQDVKIKLSGIYTMKTQGYEKIQENYHVEESYTVNINSVTISFVTKSMGEEYKFSVDYSFNARGDRQGVVSGREPVNSIDDLNLNELDKVVQWSKFDRIYLRVHQGG